VISINILSSKEYVMEDEFFPWVCPVCKTGVVITDPLSITETDCGQGHFCTLGKPEMTEVIRYRGTIMEHKLRVEMRSVVKVIDENFKVIWKS
jgi:hypothetical protein